MNWNMVDIIHPESNNFVVGVKISAAVDSKHNDSPSYSS